MTIAERSLRFVLQYDLFTGAHGTLVHRFDTLSATVKLYNPVDDVTLGIKLDLMGSFRWR